MNRRMLLSCAAGAAVGGVAAASPALAATVKPFTPVLGPRSRVIYVNDVSGDIDGLFATVHAVLSPAIQLRAIVGTGTRDEGQTASASAALVNEMLRLMGRNGTIKVHEGAPGQLKQAGVPIRSPGTQAIIDEALRTDTQLPLYVAVGGGLTEVASALMLEPRVAERCTLVWIGGMPIPGQGGNEYNLMIDPIATQYVFNETSVPIWQISSAVYSTCQISDTELQAFVAPCGAIGAWLYNKVIELSTMLGTKFRFNTGETWTLGDSPLVVLTALNDWVPNGVKPLTYTRTGSSHFDEIPAPRINLDGSYEPRADGRKIRAYRSVDTRMMFSDFFAKLSLNFRG